MVSTLTAYTLRPCVRYAQRIRHTLLGLHEVHSVNTTRRQLHIVSAHVQSQVLGVSQRFIGALRRVAAADTTHISPRISHVRLDRPGLVGGVLFLQ